MPRWPSLEGPLHPPQVFAALKGVSLRPHTPSTTPLLLTPPPPPHPYSSPPPQAWFGSVACERRRAQLSAMTSALSAVGFQRVALHLPVHVFSSAHTHALQTFPWLTHGTAGLVVFLFPFS